MTRGGDSVYLTAEAVRAMWALWAMWGVAMCGDVGDVGDAGWRCGASMCGDVSNIHCPPLWWGDPPRFCQAWTLSVPRWPGLTRQTLSTKQTGVYGADTYMAAPPPACANRGIVSLVRLGPTGGPTLKKTAGFSWRRGVSPSSYLRAPPVRAVNAVSHYTVTPPPGTLKLCRIAIALSERGRSSR